MTPIDLGEQCELGQRQLMEMQYLQAEATLAAAEERAWEQRDFDTLTRLLLPLQEARRQRRQRCGEGIICLDILADGPEGEVDADRVVEEIPQGQILIAGWETITPAVRARQLQAERGLYLDIFLAAVNPQGMVLFFPLEAASPAFELKPDDLPHGRQLGTPRTYGFVMSLWERLHAPFLAEADATPDLVTKIEGYRRTIQVDYACEFAHQRMADAIKQLAH
jgi:hypothetical protein